MESLPAVAQRPIRPQLWQRSMPAGLRLLGAASVGWTNNRCSMSQRKAIIRFSRPQKWLDSEQTPSDRFHRLQTSASIFRLSQKTFVRMVLLAMLRSWLLPQLEQQAPALLIRYLKFPE